MNAPKGIQNHLGLLLSTITTLCIVWIGWQTGLFWDNILFIHRYGDVLLENGLTAWGSIPEAYDSGHPLLPATYLAGMWKIFGQTIVVTHLALAPFIFLFCYTLWSIIHALFDDIRWATAAFVIVLADPSVFCQLMYIGPEIFVLCFTAISIYGVIKQNRVLQTIGLMCLGITSLRGMMLCAGVFLWDLCRNRKVNIGVYLLGAIPAVVFLVGRLITKGWIISNPLSPWGNAFGYQSTADFIHNLTRNAIVQISRILDFGRIVPVIIVSVLLIIRRKEWPSDKRTVDLLLLTALICTVVVVTSLIIINPMGHNYFLWMYIGIALLLVSLLQGLPWRKIGYGCAICALLLGNCIIYPERISQGWPCSLASLPYWSLRLEMLNYMEEASIAPEQTLTFFPFGHCADDIDMHGDKRPYADSWETAEYVIASNICNLDDETLDKVLSCTPIKRFEKRGVTIALYRITP